MGIVKEFVKGLWNDNPTFRLQIGLCPTLAVTSSALNGVGMGAATTFVPHVLQHSHQCFAECDS